MPEPPSVIKVGPYQYTVSQDEVKLRDYEHQQRNGYSGYSDHSKLEIIVDPTLADDQQAETLWHEVKHCVYNVVGWRDGALKEEEVIRRAAPMELAVLRENPALVAFLVGKPEP